MPRDVKTRPAVTVSRKALLSALAKVASVIPSRSGKPILQGVLLRGGDGMLELSATDLEIAVTVAIPVTGKLPRCILVCRDMQQRLKASQSKECTLAFDAKRQLLIVNGGPVEHSLPTFEPSEFPVCASACACFRHTTRALDFSSTIKP